ncbi:MAG: hypothetical protein IJ141_07700 [Lachnospiraceae bacterium]|nr:hypothetical protein [Lachnospiraceae bacterium]
MKLRKFIASALCGAMLVTGGSYTGFTAYAKEAEDDVTVTEAADEAYVEDTDIEGVDIEDADIEETDISVAGGGFDYVFDSQPLPDLYFIGEGKDFYNSDKEILNKYSDMATDVTGKESVTIGDLKSFTFQDLVVVDHEEEEFSDGSTFIIPIGGYAKETGVIMKINVKSGEGVQLSWLSNKGKSDFSVVEGKLEHASTVISDSYLNIGTEDVVLTVLYYGLVDKEDYTDFMFDKDAVLGIKVIDASELHLQIPVMWWICQALTRIK